MIKTLSLDNNSPFLERKNIKFPMEIDFIPMRVPENGHDLMTHMKEKVKNRLSDQAKKCARKLLNSIDCDYDKEDDRFLRKCIWESVKASPQIFCSNESRNDNELIFALGHNLNNHIITNSNEIAVVAKTKIALPVDEIDNTLYFPILKKQKETVFYKWPYVAARTPSLLPCQSYWKPGLFRTAEKALTAAVDFRIAAWCIEQRPGGRHYIDLVPTTNEQADYIWRRHVETRVEFQTEAVEEYILKWEAAIPRKAFEELFNKKIYIFKKDNKPIMDEDNDPAYVYGFNTHHLHPMFWGGGNKTRVYIDRYFHEYIHQDFDCTFRVVNKCIKNHSHKASKNILDADYLQKFLTSNPHVVHDLKKIPNVKVEDGAISIAILWPQEKVCIPSLLQFEYQYGGIYAPHEKGYVDGSSYLKYGDKIPLYNKYLIS